MMMHLYPNEGHRFVSADWANDLEVPVPEIAHLFDVATEMSPYMRWEIYHQLEAEAFGDD